MINISPWDFFLKEHFSKRYCQTSADHFGLRISLFSLYLHSVDIPIVPEAWEGVMDIRGYSTSSRGSGSPPPGERGDKGGLKKPSNFPTGKSGRKPGLLSPSSAPPPPFSLPLLPPSSLSLDSRGLGRWGTWGAGGMWKERLRVTLERKDRMRFSSFDPDLKCRWQVAL